MNKIHAVKLFNLFYHAIGHVSHLFMVVVLKLLLCFRQKMNTRILSWTAESGIVINHVGRICEDRFKALELYLDGRDELLLYAAGGETDEMQHSHFFNVKKHQNVVLTCGEFKTGIVYIEKTSQLDYRNLLRTYMEMKKNADVVHLYIDEEITASKVFDIKKKLFRIGFDSICILSENIFLCTNRGAAKRLLKNHVYSAYDPAVFDAEPEKRKAIIVKQSFQKHENRWIATVNGYDFYEDNPRKEIAKAEDIRIPAEGTVFMDPWGSAATFGDLWDALGLDIPSKYDVMGPCSFANLCARVAEVGVGSVFFYRQPLRHNNDTKRFIDLFYIRVAIRAYLEGCRFVVSYRKLPFFIPHVVVDDAIEAHITAIAFMRHRRNGDMRTIGVTGSIGKTTTKEMLYSVLSKEYVAQKNDRNGNVQAKIGINMQSAHPDTQVYIQEIGGGRPMGASKHSRMISPDVAIVTNIGTAHIGNYESQEDLCRHKLKISDGFPKDGVLFLNGDDPLLAKAETGFRQVLFATDNKQADYYAEDIILEPTYSEFKIVHGEKKIPARIHVPGKHNILNALCCFAIGEHYGMDHETILRGLEDFQTSGSRQNILHIGSLKVFADCFNASYESVCSAFETLGSMVPGTSGGKRIVVLGELTGLGAEQQHVNEMLADLVDHSCADYVIYYMPKAKANVPPFKNVQKVRIITGEKKLEEWIYQHVHGGDVLLFKGSSKVRLDEVIDTLYGTDLADERYIDESLIERVENRHFSFNVFEYYSTLAFSFSSKEILKMNHKIYGKYVKKIADEAFRGLDTLRHAALPKKVIYVGRRAFFQCINLESIKNTKSIKCIGSEAFAGVEKLGAFEFGEHLFYIGDHAFEGCRRLKTLRIPKSVLYIGAEAFKDCTSLETVYVEGNPVIEKDAFENCENVNIVFENRDKQEKVA